MKTETYIRIALAVVALALIIFKNYDAGGAIVLVMTIYHGVIKDKDEEIASKEVQINNLQADVRRFRESK